MSTKIEAKGRVEPDGSLKIINRRFFDLALKTLSGKDVDITIQRRRRVRSNPQNRWYWGVAVPLVFKGLRDVGYNEIMDEDDAHEVLKAMFNKKDFCDPSTGEIIKYGASTTKMTTTEFMDYTSSIQQWAAEHLNVFIPDPIELEATI